MAALSAANLTPTWLFAASGVLALASAISLRRMWRVRMYAALLFAVGAIVTSGSAGALWHAGQSSDTALAATPGAWFELLSSDEAYVRGDEDGREQARTDLEQSIRRIEIYGLQASWAYDFEAYMKTTYGIDYVEVAGCMASAYTLGHADGYNDVMRRAIVAELGEDVFEPPAYMLEAIERERMQVQQRIEEANKILQKKRQDRNPAR